MINSSNKPMKLAIIRFVAVADKQMSFGKGSFFKNMFAHEIWKIDTKVFSVDLLGKPGLYQTLKLFLDCQLTIDLSSWIS